MGTGIRLPLPSPWFSVSSLQSSLAKLATFQTMLRLALEVALRACAPCPGFQCHTL